MNRLLILTFFFTLACSQPQSRIFPEDSFSKSENFPSFEYTNHKAVSAFSRLTLRRLLVKHVVNLSTLFLPPNNIRVDIFNSGLPKLLFLVSRNQSNVQLVAPEEHTVYFGESDARPLEKIMGFPLSEVFLLNLLLGKSSIPTEFDFVEHSRRSIYRFEFKEDSGFRYRIYFKKIKCRSLQETDRYKFSGLEVLSKEDEYLFFAKVKFEDSNKICSDVYPAQVEFENFNNRFSGLIDKIQINSNVAFKEQEVEKIFSPDFPGYIVKPLLRSDF